MLPSELTWLRGYKVLPNKEWFFTSLTHPFTVLSRLKCAKLPNKLAFLNGEEGIFLSRLQNLICLVVRFVV
jgi:hypothetical protein